MAGAPLFRIWLDDAATLFCLVDEIDYTWAVQWKWRPKWDRTKTKIYAVRNTRAQHSRGPQTTVFLHKAIVLRTYGEAPDEHHTIGDHLDGNSLDNRRHNLRWATKSMNRRNRHGSAATHIMLRM